MPVERRILSIKRIYVSTFRDTGITQRYECKYTLMGYPPVIFSEVMVATDELGAMASFIGWSDYHLQLTPNEEWRARYIQRIKVGG